MKLTQINAEQWKQVKEIYMEAFPKAERKPFFVLRHSVKSKKAQIQIGRALCRERVLLRV